MNSSELISAICDYADAHGISFETALEMLQRMYDDDCGEWI